MSRISHLNRMTRSLPRSRIAMNITNLKRQQIFLKNKIESEQKKINRNVSFLIKEKIEFNNAMSFIGLTSIALMPGLISSFFF